MIVTIKRRIEQFWEWFRSGESHFFLQLQQGNAAAVKEEIDNRFRACSLPLCCCAGWDPRKKTAYLGIICNGEKTTQFIALFWKEHAPYALLARWEFHTSKPASKQFPLRLELGGDVFSCENWAVLFGQNDASKKFELQVCSPDFAPLSPGERMMRIMLALRETFGEAFTEIYFGSVQALERKPEKLPGNMIFCTFPRFAAIARTAPQKLGWPVCHEPTMVCYGYHIQKPAQKDVLREDITSGVIRNPRLLEEPSSTADSFRASGGAYQYFYYENPPLGGMELELFRNQVSGQVEHFLGDYDLGYLIGTACGLSYSYLDMMIFDPPAFSAIFRDLYPRFDADLYLRPFGASGYLQ